MKAPAKAAVIGRIVEGMSQAKSETLPAGKFRELKEGKKRSFFVYDLLIL